MMPPAIAPDKDLLAAQAGAALVRLDLDPPGRIRLPWRRVLRLGTAASNGTAAASTI